MKKALSLLIMAILLISSVSCAAPSFEAGEVLSNENMVSLNADEETQTIVASDAAYIRSGSHQNTNFKDTQYYFIKNDGVETTRHVIVKYDISRFTEPLQGTANAVINFFSVSPIHESTGETEIKLKAYKETSNWSSDSVTFSSFPALSESNYIGQNDLIKNDVYIDITPYINDAIRNGEKTITIRFVPSTRTVAEMRVSTLSSDFAPRLVIQNRAHSFYRYDVLKNEEANKALWDYGKQVYDEWYARYQEILTKGDNPTTAINSNSGDYTLKTEAKDPNTLKTTTFNTRLATTLNGFTPNASNLELDEYGGIISDTRYEATGYFYTKNVNGRWLIIDPLGYPCYITGLNHVYYAYSQSKYQTKAMAKKFGSEEKWALSTTRWLKDSLGFNVSLGTDATVLGVENGSATTIYVPGVGKYAASVGLNSSTGGTTDFLYNNAMPVFDPAFVTYVNEIVPQAIGQYKNEDRILGFISDNELPTDDSMLINYLTLDPTIAANHYSYVCAWTWITEITGKSGDEINVADIVSLSKEAGVDLVSLFKGFVYDKYFSVMQPAIKSACPNHMYLGVRLLTGFQWGEWVGRFNGYWCDIMCINYYGEWEIPVEQLNNFEKWTGKPFMITEFYAKGSDAIGADGKPFVNTDGAGWICKNQTDRGYFYQNYTLRLLETKNCVGWLYFQYIDNDPTDESVERGQQNSNKGIVNSDHDREIYDDCHSQMALINKNKYSLIEYFDKVDYFK